MQFLITTKFIGKIIFPLIASAALLFSQIFTQLRDIFTLADITNDAPLYAEILSADTALQTAPEIAQPSQPLDLPAAVSNQIVETAPAYPYANPAGCAVTQPQDLTPEQMLANVQNAIGEKYNLAERRQLYIWNGSLGTMLNVTDDPFVYEFTFNEFQHPLTYLGDEVATVFLTQGFVVWFREYNGSFRLLAIPMTDGVLQSQWSSYITSYWQKDGTPNDAYIYSVMKKLPCHWVIDSGYVTNETVDSMFNLNWQVPDYLTAGRQYLAENCAEAQRVSEEMIGYPNPASMCGPLAWTILRDANSFPYRIGSWSANAAAFTGANPKWNDQPWGTFDPATYTLFHTDQPMGSYDFQTNGNLYTGDVIYSYATLYVTPGYFDHIFVVAGIDENNTRLTISNIVRNMPERDCMIEELPLYTPGDLTSGAINYEWNGYGSGRTGTSGFDVFRWNWATYHNNGQAMQYTVRWGDTLETVAFDWKISPEMIEQTNQLASDAQLIPGQVIILPALVQPAH